MNCVAMEGSAGRIQLPFCKLVFRMIQAPDRAQVVNMTLLNMQENVDGKSPYQFEEDSAHLGSGYDDYDDLPAAPWASVRCELYIFQLVALK